MIKVELHDIFPTVAIVEYSLYYFIFPLFIVITIFSTLLIYLRKRKKHLHKYLHILALCDMTESKRTAQQFSYYAKRLTKTQDQVTLYLEIQSKLSTYKYDKTPKTLPLVLQEDIKAFIQKIRDENV